MAALTPAHRRGEAPPGSENGGHTSHVGPTISPTDGGDGNDTATRPVLPEDHVRETLGSHAATRADATRADATADGAALRRISARLEAMPVAILRTPAVDPRSVAVAALMVANFVAANAVAAPFASLATMGLMDAHALEDLAVLARFVLRVLPKLGTDFVDLQTVGPPELEHVCRAHRADLLEFAERHLSGIDEAHGRMATVRLGRTAAEIVFDLRMLAELCEDYESELPRDRAAYAPSLASRARELAQRLELALIGRQSEEAKEWRLYLLRAWTAAIATYEEVRRAGRFLHHRDKPEARFPSLSAVMRVRRRVKRDAALVSEPQIGDSRSTLPFPVSSTPELDLVESGPARSSRDEAGMAVFLERHLSQPSSGDFDADALERAASRSSTEHDLVPSSVDDPFAPLHPVTLEVNHLSESNFYAGLGGSDEVGIFMATFIVKPPGTRLAISLRLPTRAEPLKLRGTVRWVREFSPAIETSPGMGISLERLGPEARASIQQFTNLRPPLFYDE